MTSTLDAFLTRADIADLALLFWALSSSGALVMCFRELIAANRRFDAFVRALADFNKANEENHG
jgi:hypothetical protein